MDSDWSKICEIVTAALRIKSPAERSDFLDRQCGGDSRFKSRIEALLKEKDGLSHEDEVSGAEPSSNSIDAPTIQLRRDDTIRYPLDESPQITRSCEDNRYELRGEIARGGMGAVLLARDRKLGRDLAIKVLLEAHGGNEDSVRRFLEEAQIGGQLQHPGIAPVYDLGSFDGDLPFFSMKLVKGETLSALLNNPHKKSPDRSTLLNIFQQVCQTMAYTHSRGVIHRDLKPSNVMVGAFGEVQIVDWGLAKVLRKDQALRHSKDREEPNAAPKSVIRTKRSSDTETDDDTRFGSVMGTLAYMSPEQALGDVDRLDERTDVFGLGAILCELLTGAPAYVSSDSHDLYLQAVQGQVGGAYKRLDRCGEDSVLIELAKDCLSVSLEDRPRDAGKVAERFSAHLASIDARLRETQLEAAAASAREAEAKNTAREERRRRRVTLAFAAAAIVAFAIGGLVWNNSHRKRLRLRHGLEKLIVDAESNLSTIDPNSELSNDSTKRFAKARDLTIKAESLANAGQFPELVDRIGSLNSALRAVDASSQKRAKEQEFIDQVSTLQDATIQVSTELNVLHQASADQRYPHVFRGIGVDVLSEDPNSPVNELATKSQTLRNAALIALEEWWNLEPVDARRRRISFLIEKLDNENEWRKSFRLAREQNDSAAMKSLAASVETHSQPAIVLISLSRQLGSHEAIDLLKRSVMAHPDDFWLNHEAYHRTRIAAKPDYFESIEFARAAVAIRPIAGAYMNLGGALVRLGRKNQALMAYEEAAAIETEYFAAHRMVATLRESLQEYEAAIESVEEMLRIRPDLPDSHLLHGELLSQLGRDDDACSAFATAFELNRQSPVVCRRLAYSLWRLGLKEESYAALIQAYELGADAGAARDSEDGQLIAEITEICKRANTDAMHLFENEGLRLLLQGKFIDSQNLQEELLKRKIKVFGPDHLVVANAYMNLGLTLSGREDYIQAEKFFTKAVEIRTQKSGPSHRDVATALVEASKARFAQRSKDAKVGQEPIQMATKALAIRTRELGDLHPLTQQTSKLVAAMNSGNVAIDRAHLGQGLSLDKEFAIAAKLLLDETFSLHEDFMLPILDASHNTMSSRRGERAAKALLLNPHASRNAVTMAEALAIRSLELATNLDRKTAARLTIGMAQYRTREFKEAQENLEYALHTGYYDARSIASSYLALVAHDLGDNEGALDRLLKAEKQAGLTAHASFEAQPQSNEGTTRVYVYLALQEARTRIRGNLDGISEYERFRKGLDEFAITIDEALNSEKPLAHTDTITLGGLNLAALYSWFNREDDRIELCKSISSQFLPADNPSNDRFIKERIAKMILCSPCEDSVLTNLAIRHAKEAEVASRGNSYHDWFLITRGIAEYRDENWGKAITSLSEIFRRGDPDDEKKSLALSFRAMAYHQRGEHKKAESDFDIVIKIMGALRPRKSLSEYLADQNMLIANLAFEEARTELERK